MAKFKIGDKVKCTDSWGSSTLRTNQSYTISDIHDNGRLVSLLEIPSAISGHTLMYKYTRFSLLPDYLQHIPVYYPQKGDKVTCVKGATNLLTEGEEYVVSKTVSGLAGTTLMLVGKGNRKFSPERFIKVMPKFKVGDIVILNKLPAVYDTTTPSNRYIGQRYEVLAVDTSSVLLDFDSHDLACLWVSNDKVSSVEPVVPTTPSPIKEDIMKSKNIKYGVRASTSDSATLYDDYNDALDHAKNLARVNPQRTYIISKDIRIVKAEETPVKVTELSDF